MVMTTEQILLFSLFGVVFIFLIWGRIRFDLVAFGALMIAVLLQLIEPKEAFAGFGHPAVIIIALVLIVSRGLLNSGAVELISGIVIAPDRKLPVHIGIMAIVGAALSAIINNVAALALLMTLDIEAAKKAKRAVSLSLMPLSFATILGGMVTLIGTPPNIVIAQYRDDALGAPFTMFDFAPVGLVVALGGIAFVALIGWRLIPQRNEKGAASSTDDTELYTVEVAFSKDTKWIDQPVNMLYPLADEHDINILGLIRRGKRLRGFAAKEEIRSSDHLVIEGAPKAIEAFMGASKTAQTAKSKGAMAMGDAALALVEAIVPDQSRLNGRTAADLRLPSRYGATLLGVSRQGTRFRERVRKLIIQPGDVLLLLGPKDQMAEIADRLRLYLIADRSTHIVQRGKATMAIGAFFAAIALAVIGVTSLEIALGLCVILYAVTGIVGKAEVYETIEWKVIVLLACLIPLGAALEQSGGTELIAGLIVTGTEGWPAWSVLLVLMVVTMTLSDVLNNVATALVAAPVAVAIAKALDASPDPFLMAVAVAASCAFLTPIGHKNNTIIMGPGGYHFGDYWRMGIWLEVLVLALGLPAILFFWPL